VKLCPSCSRTMRPHCKWGTPCRWLFCGVCAIIADPKTGKHLNIYGTK
jgi:hypothetical protein